MVKREDGEQLAKEYSVTFMETSAKSGFNVEIAFMAVARYINIIINYYTYTYEWKITKNVCN